MLAKFGVADVICETLKQRVLEPAAFCAWRLALQFLQHARREALVDDVIRPVPQQRTLINVKQRAKNVSPAMALHVARFAGVSVDDLPARNVSVGRNVPALRQTTGAFLAFCDFAQL